MRSSSVFAFLAIFTLAAAGCGTDAGAGSGPAEAPQAQSSPAAVSAGASETPGGQPAAANAPVVNAAAPRSANGAYSMPASPLSASRTKQLEAMKDQRSNPGAPKPDIEQILKRSTRPAPENSEFSVALTDILVERRTFLRHPVLARAEKVTEGEKKTLYVLTRDGRRVELPGDRIESLSTASSVHILRAAGIELPRREGPPGTKPRAAKN